MFNDSTFQDERAMESMCSWWEKLEFLADLYHGIAQQSAFVFLYCLSSNLKHVTKP